MKFAAIAIAAIVAMVNVVTGASVGVEMAAADSPTAVLSQSKALEVAQSTSTPEGVEFTGSVEKIEQPAGAKETLEALQTKYDDETDTDKQEDFGSYRFDFRCGGVPGWAYPLSYWNLFGAGLYGSGCGLGKPFGGLYYC